MRHSRGPWIVNKNEHHLRIRAQDALKHEHSIALLPIDKSGDAALISAAPEMLEALENTLPLLDAFSSERWCGAKALVEAAIAKAKGES